MAQHSNLTASTEARRIADAMTLHAVAGNAGQWASFRLDSGTEVHRHATYATRVEAVRHARWNRDTVIYLEIKPDGMQPKEAQAFLSYARFMHARGWRLPSPDFEFDGTMPLLVSDQVKNVRHLVSGGKH